MRIMRFEQSAVATVLFRAILVVVAFLAAGLPGFCQRMNTEQSAAMRTVTGMALDSVDGHPISGAIVVLEDLDNQQKEFAGAKTATDGRFRIVAASASHYRITIQRQGFLRFSRVFQASEASPASGDTNVGECQMVAQSTIAGRITDADGNPLAGAAVQLSRSELNGLATAVSTVTNTVTNDLGEYRLFGLEPGAYYVSALYQDFAGLLGLRQRSARSTDKGGSETVNEDFAVTYFPGALDIQSASVIRLRPGMTASNVDIQVQFAPAAMIQGTVAGIPAGSSGARILLSPLRAGSLGAKRGFQLAPGSSAFFFKSIPPAEYVVRADLQMDGKIFSARHEVAITGEGTDILLDLQPGFAIGGKISLNGKTELPQKLKLILNGTDQKTHLALQPDAEGRFHTPIAALDRYFLTASGMDGQVYIKSVFVDAKEVSPNNIRIANGNELLRIELSDRAARIEGTAVDSDQRSTKGGLAVLMAMNALDFQSQAAAIDRNGTFRFESLSPGKYRVSCFADLTLPTDATWDIQKRVSAQGQEINIAEAERQTIVVKSEEVATQDH